MIFGGYAWHLDLSPFHLLIISIVFPVFSCFFYFSPRGGAAEVVAIGSR